MREQSKEKTSWSYMVVLAVLFIVAIFVLKASIASADPGKYAKVTIQKGDTLWQIATVYEQRSHLSRTRFINWVENTNRVKNDKLIPGQTIIIPVKKP